jgi:predicted transposase YdaD
MHIVELLFHDFNNPKNEQVRSFILKIDVYLRAISGITRKEIIEKANQSDHNLKPEAMSIFDEILELGEERGKEIGIKEGVYKEKKRTVIILFKKRRSLKSIAEFVDFPIEEVKKIIAEYVKQQQQSN